MPGGRAALRRALGCPDTRTSHPAAARGEPRPASPALPAAAAEGPAAPVAEEKDGGGERVQTRAKRRNKSVCLSLPLLLPRAKLGDL